MYGWEVFMKYTFEMGSGAKSHKDLFRHPKHNRGGYTGTQHGDLTNPLFLFF
jgi:hypothetical protein